MSVACKCDVCGQLYESKISVPDIQIRRYRHPYGEERIDLCDNCQEKLDRFIKGDKNALG